MATLIFGVATGGFGQNYPKEDYHSLIPEKRRVKAISDLVAQIRNAAVKDKEAKEALGILPQACICEPAGTGAKGGDAFRILVGAQKHSKHWFGLVPVFAEDVKASPTLKEFISYKPLANVAISRGGPFVLIRMDVPATPHRLDSIIAAIQRRGISSQ